jgi:hypothetical protein
MTTPADPALPPRRGKLRAIVRMLLPPADLGWILTQLVS